MTDDVPSLVDSKMGEYRPCSVLQGLMDVAGRAHRQGGRVEAGLPRPHMELIEASRKSLRQFMRLFLEMQIDAHFVGRGPSAAVWFTTFRCIEELLQQMVPSTEVHQVQRNAHGRR